MAVLSNSARTDANTANTAGAHSEPDQYGLMNTVYAQAAIQQGQETWSSPSSDLT